MKFLAASALIVLLLPTNCAWSSPPVKAFAHPVPEQGDLIGIVSRQVIGPNRRFIGFANRQAPIRKFDSGWAFLSGKESQEFLDEPSNSVALPIRELLEMDPSLSELMDKPAGTYWERDSQDSPWREIADYPGGP
jgi:hypothetical protein